MLSKKTVPNIYLNENYAAAKKVLKETYELDKEVPIPRHHARNLLVWFSKVMGGAPFKKYSAGERQPGKKAH